MILFFVGNDISPVYFSCLLAVCKYRLMQRVSTFDYDDLMTMMMIIIIVIIIKNIFTVLDCRKATDAVSSDSLVSIIIVIFTMRSRQS